MPRLKDDTIDQMNIFDTPAKKISVKNLQSVRKYVSGLRLKADKNTEKPDSKTEALYYQAALKQSEMTVAYHETQMKLDKTGLSHPSRQGFIDVEKNIQKELKEKIKNLQKDLPGFKNHFSKAEPRV